MSNIPRARSPMCNKSKSQQHFGISVEIWRYGFPEWNGATCWTGANARRIGVGRQWWRTFAWGRAWVRLYREGWHSSVVTSTSAPLCAKISGIPAIEGLSQCDRNLRRSEVEQVFSLLLLVVAKRRWLLLCPENVHSTQVILPNNKQIEEEAEKSAQSASSCVAAVFRGCNNISIQNLVINYK